MTDLSDPRLEDFRALVPPGSRHRVSCQNVDATALDQALINWATPVLEPLFWVPCPPERARGVALVYEHQA